MRPGLQAAVQRGERGLPAHALLVHLPPDVRRAAPLLPGPAEERKSARPQLAAPDTTPSAAEGGRESARGGGGG